MNRGTGGAENRRTEGVEGNEEGIPLPSRLRGLGERCKLSQRGPERCPGRKRVLVHFVLEKRIWFHNTVRCTTSLLVPVRR